MDMRERKRVRERGQKKRGGWERERGRGQSGFAMNVDYNVNGSWVFAGCIVTALQPVVESSSTGNSRCIGSPVIIFNALRYAAPGNLP